MDQMPKKSAGHQPAVILWLDTTSDLTEFEYITKDKHDINYDQTDRCGNHCTVIPCKERNTLVHDSGNRRG
jgi:hypothetical protein